MRLTNINVRYVGLVTREANNVIRRKAYIVIVTVRRTDHRSKQTNSTFKQ